MSLDKRKLLRVLAKKKEEKKEKLRERDLKNKTRIRGKVIKYVEIDNNEFVNRT